MLLRPLDYGSGLRLPDAEERLTEATIEFNRVKSHYQIKQGHAENLAPEDKKTLSDCLGVVLPLGLEAAVQEEAKAALATGKRLEGTLHQRTAELAYQITDYLANFENTGVRRIEGNMDL